MVKACIIEDDPIHSNKLEALLIQTSEQVVILSRSRSVAEAVANVTSDKPELVFLDIELNGEKTGGFDFLKQMNIIDFDVIFTTVSKDSAIKAVRLCALDYLVKPILLGELNDAIIHFKENKKTKLEQIKTLKANLQLEKLKGKSIWIYDEDESVKIEIENIVYARSINTTTFFYLIKAIDGKQKLVSTKSIGKWEELLEENGFCRIHNSYLVNLEHVASCKRSENTIKMITEEVLTVSKQKKELLLRQLGIK